MPHGTPDWGLVGPKETLFGLDDLGEHAVRLGSPHLWDRRGDVVILDDFEHGLGQCVITPRGAGSSYALEGGHALKGAFCAKLVAGSDGLQDCIINYRHGLAVTSRLGLEFAFTLHDDVEHIVWNFSWYTGAEQLECVVYYDLQNTQLLYLDSLGAPQVFATDVDLNIDAYCWHVGKLVTDFSFRQYVRFILNNNEWPLYHAIQAIPDLVTLPHLRFIIYNTAFGVTNPIVYIDAVVITQNEP